MAFNAIYGRKGNLYGYSNSLYNVHNASHTD